MMFDHRWAALGWFLFVAGLAFALRLATLGHPFYAGASLIAGLALYGVCDWTADRQLQRRIDALFAAPSPARSALSGPETEETRGW